MNKTSRISDVKLFDQLPEEYREAINFIVMNVLGDEIPEMNDAFRVWQAETFMGDPLAKDRKPDLQLFEIEALSFREGWEGREETREVMSSENK